MDFVGELQSGVDPNLVQSIVDHVKSKGLFDQFRRGCLADVDTKPSYQNLRQRVEGYVTDFLSKHEWVPTLNKNHLRDSLRRQINQSDMLASGVERIVEQVVEPQIQHVFRLEIQRVVKMFMGITEEATEESHQEENMELASSPESQGNNIVQTHHPDIEVTEEVTEDVNYSGDDMDIDDSQESDNADEIVLVDPPDQGGEGSNQPQAVQPAVSSPPRPPSDDPPPADAQKDGGGGASTGSTPTSQAGIVEEKQVEGERGGGPLATAGEERDSEEPARAGTECDREQQRQQALAASPAASPDPATDHSQLDQNTAARLAGDSAGEEAQLEDVGAKNEEDDEESPADDREDGEEVEEDDALSDVTVSSVHTSDLSSFEATSNSSPEYSEADSQEPRRQKKEEKGGAGNESREKTGKTKKKRLLSSTSAKSKKRALALSRYHSDSEDEETRESRRKKAAQAKEERRLRRQEVREEMLAQQLMSKEQRKEKKVQEKKRLKREQKAAGQMPPGPGPSTDPAANKEKMESLTNIKDHLEPEPEIGSAEDNGNRLSIGQTCRERDPDRAEPSPPLTEQPAEGASGQGSSTGQRSAATGREPGIGESSSIAGGEDQQPDPPKPKKRGRKRRTDSQGSTDSLGPGKKRGRRDGGDARSEGTAAEEGQAPPPLPTTASNSDALPERPQPVEEGVHQTRRRSQDSMRRTSRRSKESNDFYYPSVKKRRNNSSK